jgi:hypothetical protein
VTQLWNTAYPRPSTATIANKARIRAGLYGPMADDAARAWLARL